MPSKLAKARSEIIWVKPSTLLIDEGWNPREDYGDMDALVAWIEKNGTEQLPPLTGYFKGDRIVVKSGHRRHKAICIVSDRGAELLVPMIMEKKDYSVERRVADVAKDNGGLNLKPWEKAKIVGRLTGFGWGEKRIVEELGWSLVWIRKLYALWNAPERVIKAVKGKEASATLVMEMLVKGETELLLQKLEEGTIEKPSSETLEGELFPGEPRSKKTKITERIIRPNSVKIFKKWSPSVDADKMAPEKREVFELVTKLIKGELTEKDLKKFFTK